MNESEWSAHCWTSGIFGCLYVCMCLLYFCFSYISLLNDGNRSIAWNINMVQIFFCVAMCFGWANQKNETHPYLFRSRFDSIRNNWRKMCIYKFELRRYIFLPRLSLLLLLLFWRRSGIVAQFQLNQPIFERLFNFFLYGIVRCSETSFFLSR